MGICLILFSWIQMKQCGSIDPSKISIKKNKETALSHLNPIQTGAGGFGGPTQI